jgi:hypothetical protein
MACSDVRTLLPAPIRVAVSSPVWESPTVPSAVNRIAGQDVEQKQVATPETDDACIGSAGSVPNATKGMSADAAPRPGSRSEFGTMGRVAPVLQSPARAAPFQVTAIADVRVLTSVPSANCLFCGERWSYDENCTVPVGYLSRTGNHYLQSCSLRRDSMVLTRIRSVTGVRCKSSIWLREA